MLCISGNDIDNCRLITPQAFMSFFVHSDFLQFSLNTDLLNLLVIDHFNCLSVYFIPMHLKLEDAGRVDLCSCKLSGQCLYSLS